MKFTVLNVTSATEPYFLNHIRNISLEYQVDEKTQFETIKKKITTQDEYDLEVGRAFRIAMTEFLKTKK